MTQSILFMNYLHNVMQSRKIDIDELQYELGYRTAGMIKMWLNGQSRPHMSELLRLADALRADPIEVVAGWVIDRLPELEEHMWKQILEPMGSTFPRSDDLTLRAPKPFRF